MEPPEAENSSSLLNHLEDLRMSIIRSLLVICVLFPPGWYFSGDMIDIFKKYFCPESLVKLYYTAPMELFFLRMKIAFFLAIIVSLPYLAWNLWRFISPGLYRNEKIRLLQMSFSSSFLFLVGAAFSLFFIFPLIMEYSVGMATPEVAPLLSVKSVIGMAVLLMIGFGVSFQLPILVYVLVSMEIVSVKTIRKARPYIYVFIFLVAGIMTPPDVLSQIAMGVPTLLLFELSLFCLGYGKKQKNDDDSNKDGG